MTPAAAESPHWGPYEQVHLAINLHQAESALATARQTQANTAISPTVQTRPGKEPTRVPESSLPSAPTDSIDDLRLQVRELTSANQDLRKKLAEQTAEMEALKETLARIQQDLNQSKPKAAPRR
jgi:predicted RNase H-like nuclease (RuvC/YqgF family)